MSKELANQSAYDQYVDATVALLMEHYFAAICNKEYPNDTMDDTPFPPTLDEKCRNIIKSEIAKQKRRKALKKASRIMSTAAVFLLVMIGVLGVLFTTVEAFRVQVINFYIEKNDGYLSIKGESSDVSTQEIRNEEEQICDLLDEALPEDFSLLHQTGSIDTAFNVIYKSTTGKRFVVAVNPIESELQIDSENLDALEKIDFMGKEAILAAKGEIVQLAWIDSRISRSFYLNTDAMNMDTLLQIGEALAGIFE